MPFVTRFKRTRYDATAAASGMAGETVGMRGTIDGPVSGAIVAIPMCFGPGVISKTYNNTIVLPTGMQFQIVAIDARGTNIVATATLTVGSTKGGAQLVAGVALTAALGNLTLLTPALSPLSGTIDVQLVTNGTGTFDSATVTIYGYVAAPPTSLVERNINHA